MQPSRPLSLRDASSMRGFTRTNAPCDVRAFGWAETSTENTRAATPSWFAASPTQPGDTAWVASRSAAS